MIDSPGSNDNDKRRRDQDIQFELMNTVRSIFSTSDQGVNAFILCVMIDEGNRIKSTSISAMCDMLLALTSIYKNSDPKAHPKMFVMFNNISRYSSKKGLKLKYGKKQPSAVLPGQLITIEQLAISFREDLIETLMTNYAGSMD